MPIFSQFGKTVWQRLFNMVRILQTTALNAYGNISWQFWKFRNYKDLYGKPCKCDYMAKVVFLKQMLPTFSGHCNRYFWDIGLKIIRLPNFDMLFQLVLAKFFQKWTVLMFTESWSRDQVMQRAYWNNRSFERLFYVFLFQIRSIEWMHP